MEHTNLNPSLKDSDKMLCTMFFKFRLRTVRQSDTDLKISDWGIGIRNSGNCFFCTVFRKLLMKKIHIGVL